MNIRLNGKKVVSASTTLSGLILETGFDKKSLIAEFNFEVVRQEDWGNIHIKDGDQFELLSFVGGG